MIVFDPNTGTYKDDGSGATVDKTTVIKNEPSSNPSELANIAENKSTENTNEIFGRGSCKGITNLRKLSKIKIVGIGKRFEGSYFISECTHTISSSGFFVDFSIKTKKENIGKKDGTSTNSSGSSSTSGSNDNANAGGANDGYEYVLDPVSGTYKIKKK